MLDHYRLKFYICKYKIFFIVFLIISICSINIIYLKPIQLCQKKTLLFIKIQIFPIKTNLTEDMYPIESDFEMVGQEVFQEHSNYLHPL